MSNEQSRSVADPLKVTCGLLRADKALLLPLLGSLSFTSWWELVFTEGPSFWALVLVERVMQLLIAALVAYRWGRIMRPQPTAGPSLRSCLRSALVIGMSLWALTIFPLILVDQTDDPLFAFVEAALSISALVFALRYFFYTAVAGIFGGTLKQILTSSREITLRHPKSALHAFFGPFAITIFIVSLLWSVDPLGRWYTWTFVTSTGENLFWLLSAYTATGFTLALTGEREWRAGGLDAYHYERLTTLAVQGNASLGRVLLPRNAVKMTALATVILTGVYVRQMTAPPAESFVIKSIVAGDKSATVALELKDPSHHFRGFDPSRFALASETGYRVSTELIRASLSPDKDETIHEIEGSPSEITLYLTFATERKKGDLEALENLWLWYQLHPLSHLTHDQLNSSETIPSKGTAAPEASHRSGSVEL